MRKLFPLVGLGCAAIIVFGLIAAGIAMIIFGAGPLLEKWRSSKSPPTEQKQEGGNQPKIIVPPGPLVVPEVVNLLEARRDHSPRFRAITPGKNKGNAPIKPTDAILTTYTVTSRVGLPQQHQAYLSKDFADQKTHPVIVWAHDGFDGINPDMWKMTDVFRKEGFIVMCPSFRGEHLNPGQVETFYGEVDDLLAAVDHAAKLPEADAQRVYVVGYKGGATIALLAATTGTTKVRAFFALGPIPDMDEFTRVKGQENQPLFAFSITNTEEVRLRSAIRFARFIRSPTYILVPKNLEPQAPSAIRMTQLAAESRSPVWSHVIHKAKQDELEKVFPMMIDKLKEDRDTKVSLTFSDEELKKLFD